MCRECTWPLRQEFFDQLAAYTGTLCPAAVALWLASVLAGVWLMSARRSHDRWISGFLAVRWAWPALAYHVAFFTHINPAAWLCAVMCLLQARLFFWSGAIGGHPSFVSTRTAWTPVG